MHNVITEFGVKAQDLNGRAILIQQLLVRRVFARVRVGHMSSCMKMIANIASSMMTAKMECTTAAVTRRPRIRRRRRPAIPDDSRSLQSRPPSPEPW